MPDAVWFSTLGVGLLAGAASTPHCAAMCGPLSGLACGLDRSAGPATNARMWRYQAGRVAGYALLGALAGRLGAVFTEALAARAGWWLPVLSGLAMLWLARRLWAPRGGITARFTRLGRPGRAARMGRRLLAILPREAGALGALSALLPCGALYAGVLLATATARAELGALLMFGFALTSGLALVVAARLLRLPVFTPGHRFARLLSLGLVLAACVLIARPLRTAMPGATAAAAAAASGGAGPACH